ncbi:MAG: hypothetical protein JNJ57_13185 [Saprospiraceae bacterium]|nr:hypothetical protein [Saprospiraceae bacterium]
MEGINWNPVSHVYRIDTIGHDGNQFYSEFDLYFEYIKDSLSDFDLFQFSASGIGLVGEYTYSSDTFNLSFKMVCLTQGTYFLENSSGAIGLASYQDFPGRCGRDPLSVYPQMNDGIGNNFEFFEESPDSFWNTWYAQQQRDVFLQSGGYCFKVVK